MKKILFAAVAALSLTACGQKADPNAYTINGTATGMDGEVVVLMQGRADTLAVDTIVDGKFTLTGIADSIPQMGVVMTDREHADQLFLEPGTITVSLDDMSATGTPLNDALEAFSKDINAIMEQSNDPSVNQDSLYEVYTNKIKETSAAHVGDALGLMLVQELVYDMSKAEVDSLMNLCDLYKNDERICRIAEAKVAEEATSAGKPYIDIVGTDALTGDSLKLSDILAKGKPMIVDFWASWCGPCRREISGFLKQYAPKYAGKVNFVGIAVWENSVEDTQNAMKALEITWPVIYAGGREDSQTAKYGINSIPQIMLIDADGTIVARGLREEAIAKAIDELLAK